MVLRGDEVSGAGKMGLSAPAGEQAIVADSVEALGQDVDEKAADELVGAEGHDTLARV